MTQSIGATAFHVDDDAAKTGFNKGIDARIYKVRSLASSGRAEDNSIACAVVVRKGVAGVESVEQVRNKRGAGGKRGLDLPCGGRGERGQESHGAIGGTHAGSLLPGAGAGGKKGGEKAGVGLAHGL